MRFSYDRVWADAVALLRADRSALVALAGAFLVLPSLLLGHFLPIDASGDDMLKAMVDHFSRHWPWHLAATLVQILGQIVILRLFLHRDGRTVGGAIAASFALVPTYFAATFLANFMTGIGILLLILPGLYIFARVSVAGAAIVAERQMNPIDALQRSFALTRGQGWRILGLFALVYVVGLVAGVVASQVLGSLFILAAGREIGLLLALIVSSIVAAATEVVVLAVSAALYERLRGSGQDQLPSTRGI